jgi:hypothetical protein
LVPPLVLARLDSPPIRRMAALLARVEPSDDVADVVATGASTSVFDGAKSADGA